MKYLTSIKKALTQTLQSTILTTSFMIFPKIVSPQKSKFVYKKHEKKCNKWMNKTCFEAKREFEKRKKEFLKFPSNIDRRMVFMHAKKKYKWTLYFAEKPFKEKNLYRIAQLDKKAPKQFWTALNSLLYDTMRNKSNSIHPNSWKPYFQKLLNVQKMNEGNLTTAQILTDIENDMKSKTGPLDFDFNTDDITSAIKSLKLNKANFGIVKI